MEDQTLPILIIDSDRRYLITKLTNSIVQVFFETSGTSNIEFQGLLTGLFIPCYGLIDNEYTPNYVHKMVAPRDTQWYLFILTKVSKIIEPSNEQEKKEVLFFLKYFKSWEQLHITAQYNNILTRNKLINFILNVYALDYTLILDRYENYRLIKLNEYDKLLKKNFSTINKISTSSKKYDDKRTSILQTKNLIRGERLENLQKNYDATEEAMSIIQEIDPLFNPSLEYQKDLLNQLFQYYGFNKELALIY